MATVEIPKGAQPVQPGMPGAMPGAMPMGNPCMGMAPMQPMQPGMPMSNAMPVPPPGGKMITFRQILVEKTSKYQSHMSVGEFSR